MGVIMPERIELNRNYKGVTICKYRHANQFFTMEPYFHSLSEPELIGISSQQRYTQALARRVVNRIQELRNINWVWQTKPGYNKHVLVSENLGILNEENPHIPWFYVIEFNTDQMVYDNVSIFYIGIIDNQRTRNVDADYDTPNDFLSEMRNIRNVNVRRNMRNERIEIMIPEPPNQTIRRFLRANDYTWRRTLGVWVRNYDEIAMHTAQQLFGLLEPEPVQPIRQRPRELPIIDANDDSILFS